MKMKHWDIIAVVAAGVFACSTFVALPLYIVERDRASQYKALYESSIQDYNNLKNQYNDLYAELSSGTSETGSSSTRKILENGNFVSGKDFPAGTYDIEAVSGKGNVYSDNFIGGINAIMGVPSEDPYGSAEKKYSNISLPEGTTLTVDGVKVRITRVGD